MKRKTIFRITIICILLFTVFSSAAYAANYDMNQIDITQYIGLLTLLVIVLGVILAGLFIVLIISYIGFKKSLQAVYELAVNKENNKNENVINIRKHNDKELLEKLYSHIDKRLDEIS